MSVAPVNQINTVKALQHFLKRAPESQRLMGKFVAIGEGVGANQHIGFIQSVGSCWLPKAIVARSWAEQVEQGFLEFVENGLYFYSIPFFANRLFKKPLQQLAPKKFATELLSKPVTEIAKKSPQALKNVTPVKAAIILASLSALVGEYSLSFFKNLQTEKLFRKSKFSDVVNLSQGTMTHNENSPVAQKAWRRIKQCAIVAGSMLAGAILLARFGSKSAALQKFSNRLVKTFDFDFAKGGKLGLSKSQLRAIVITGGVSYLDAARDKLEQQEIFTRVICMIVPYYCFGKEILQAGTIKLFGKNVPNVLTPDKKGVKSFEGLTDFVMDKATQKLKASGKATTQANLLKEANGLFQPLLKAKNNIFFGPFAFGVVVVGFGTALLSQYWTRVRFEKSQEIRQHAAKHPEEVMFRAPQLYEFPKGYKGQVPAYAGYPYHQALTQQTLNTARAAYSQNA
jgi:hypothetical protein